MAPNSIPTQTFDWGAIEWFVSPGAGHDRHNHPDAEEVLYVLSGTGDQMLEDGMR